MDFDEKAAIDYIRERLPEASNKEYNDDEILNVIDMIWDYYEDNGFLKLDLDEDGPEELDIDDLLAYVKRMVAKDRNSPLSIEDVETIVKAELDYEDSLDND